MGGQIVTPKKPFTIYRQQYIITVWKRVCFLKDGCYQMSKVAQFWLAIRIKSSIISKIANSKRLSNCYKTKLHSSSCGPS